MSHPPPILIPLPDRRTHIHTHPAEPLSTIPLAPLPHPQDRNDVGSYRLSFTLPTAWSLSHTHILLHFGASGSSAMHVWLNGRLVGYSEDSKAPAEFAVTHLLLPSPQTNLLAVETIRWSDGSYLQGQDMWRLSGISRHVHLLTRPAVHVRGLAVTPSVTGLSPGGITAASVRVSLQVHRPPLRAPTSGADMADSAGNDRER
jgi:beta-galactosidase/beta-glucuronidase